MMTIKISDSPSIKWLLIVLLIYISFVNENHIYRGTPLIASIQQPQSLFNSSYAYSLIEKQMEFGARYPGSEEINKTRNFIISELSTNWEVRTQSFVPNESWNADKIELINIIATPKTYNQQDPLVLLMAHYDTRYHADRDPDFLKRTHHVPGANDGASGVAVCIALGEALINNGLSNIQLLFFDGEDQGGIAIAGSGKWPWIVGSSYYAEKLDNNSANIYFGILLDMVGAKNATFKKEINSLNKVPELVDTIWTTATNYNYSSYFPDEKGLNIIDDHIPFLDKNIPVIDIIDDLYRYKPWHTTFDNISQISEQTLRAVGQTCEYSIIELVTNNTSIYYQQQITSFAPTIISISSLLTIIGIKSILIKKKQRKG